MEKKVEEWRPIQGFSAYEVSNFGRVRSYFARRAKMGAEWYISDEPQRILRPAKSQGYPLVRLRNDEGKYVSHRVHALVMLAFVGSPPNDMEVCHNNGNKNDNRLENLRYDTHIANANDYSVLRVFSEEEATEIRERYASGENGILLSEEFGVACSTIYGMCRGETYKNVGGPLRRGHITRLSGQDFSDIRKRRKSGEALMAIAKDYDVSQSYICKICNGTRGV